MLRRLIWHPLEEYVEDSGLLLVVPDGPLVWFPLGALPGKEPGTYLLEERQIALVPVPNLLPAILSAPEDNSDKDTVDGAILLVGDVDFGCSAGFACRSRHQPG